MEDIQKIASDRFENLAELLKDSGGITQSFATVSQYVEYVRETSTRGQNQDLDERERDPTYALNNARIVGQIWFRGQRDSGQSLRPGLYRDERWAHLMKSTSRSKQAEIAEDQLFEALPDVEHDQRIDFTNYGHLLNEVNQARTPIGWYFLMQHHGIPTRLLDWTTNALAGLFFALEAYSRKAEEKRGSSLSDSEYKLREDSVAVRILDAYWMAGRLSEEWGSSMLPYSEDTSRDVPALDS